MLFKIGDGTSGSSSELYWDNLYHIAEYPNHSRMKIGSASDEIPLILDLCKGMDGPFGILFILLVSRLGKLAGRYQIPYSLSYEELELFLYENQEFFERDGRHHLWVSSISGEGQFIYDNHNFIYAYGNLNSYCNKLKSHGYQEGLIKISNPHTHNYHPEFDSKEDELMGRFEWKYYPLQEGDDP